MRVVGTLALLFMTNAAFAQPTKSVLADSALLKAAGIKLLAVEPMTSVALAEINAEEEARLAALAHEEGRCGGFESLPENKLSSRSLQVTHAFGQLAEQEMKNRRFVASTSAFMSVTAEPAIAAAVESVREENVRSTVEFLSNFPSRVHTQSNPNTHVEAMKARIEALTSQSSLPTQVDLISHSSTRQKSIRVRITGSERPNEIVVMGGHLDSINQSWWGGDRSKAPGSDDNASGSACIFEALRVMLTQSQPKRTVEFFWYAGEEGGLLGSGEIARDYKSQNKDVIGVLQLDMTLFPGDGEFVLGSMNDFTSAWLRSYLETLNGLYIKAKIVDDKCGYGCSDHASWHRQGYPALMPFEASFNGMNHNIHTDKDVIDSQSNFKHAAMFGKIAVAFGMDLGNSDLKSP